jgi:hypothetical protein
LFYQAKRKQALLESNLPGRDMALFHIQNHKQTQWLNISLIRKIIIEKIYQAVMPTAYSILRNIS